MNQRLEALLDERGTHKRPDQRTAMKEIVQEIALRGLARAGFFARASFYGGSALRLFHGLPRFSEDLDFALDAPDPDFALSPYFPALRETAAEYGLNVTVAEKTKVLQGSVRSAELKGGMREHLIHFFAEAADGACANEVVRIRFDVDTNPPAGAVHETRHLAAPDSCPVRLHAIPSLFAGKILAVLCRGWRGRVKGRDLYDFAFYLSLGARFSLPYLHAGLIRAGRLSPEDACTPDTVRDMLCARFASLDFAMARDDAAPFVRDPAPLALWSADHFAGLAQELGAEDGC